MFSIKAKKGITMISLMVMVIVIIIVIGISLYTGTDLIKKVKLEAIQTNMISIRAKGKGIAEKVNAQIWTEENKVEKRKESYLNNYGLIFVSEEPHGVSQSPLSSVSHECYEITQDTLKVMSLDDIYDEEDKYYIIFASDDYTNLDIIYANGIIYKNIEYFSLAKIQEDIGMEE